MNDQIKQLQDEISNAEAAIKAAKDKKYKIEREAEKEYWDTVSPFNKRLNELAEEYKDLAIQLAEEKNVPPYSRWGNQLDPTEVEATPEGIHLTWDADEHYNCVYHTITWEELLSVEKNESEDEDE